MINLLHFTTGGDRSFLSFLSVFVCLQFVPKPLLQELFFPSNILQHGYCLRGRKPSFGVVAGSLKSSNISRSQKENACQRQLSSIQGDFRGTQFQIILSSRETLQNKGNPSLSFFTFYKISCHSTVKLCWTEPQKIC